MTNYQSNIDLAGVAELLRRARRVVVTTHAKPDGDAFGSVVAMAAALKRLGKSVEAWLMPPIPVQFQTLEGWGLVKTFDPQLGIAGADLVVVLDSGAWSQLQPMRGFLESHLDRVLIVDHHLSGNVGAGWRYIDGRAAAVCEIVAELLDVLGGGASGAGGGKPVDLFDSTVCEALFAGLASDTGWFRFSNTRPESHQLAARLLSKGVDHARIYRLLEQTERPEKLELLQRALGSLRYIAGGRAAVMVLRAQDFLETGAKLEETERFVDLPQIVDTVQLVVLITEPPVAGGKPQAFEGRRVQGGQGGGGSSAEADSAAHAAAIRISFRSKPGLGAVNVAQLAEQLGGGGHARAAGAQMNATLSEVVERVIQEILACEDTGSPVGAAP